MNCAFECIEFGLLGGGRQLDTSVCMGPLVLWAYLGVLWAFLMWPAPPTILHALAEV